MKPSPVGMATVAGLIFILAVGAVVRHVYGEAVHFGFILGLGALTAGAFLLSYLARKFKSLAQGTERCLSCLMVGGGHEAWCPDAPAPSPGVSR